MVFSGAKNSMAFKIFFLSLILLLSLAPAYAQNRKLSIKEGTTVVIKFSPDFLDFQHVSGYTGRTSYIAKVTRGADGSLAVNGRTDWRDAGWSFMTEFALAKVDRQRDYVEIELRSGILNQKIQFDNSVGDLDKAFDEVVFTGSLDQFTGTNYYQTEVVDRLLAKKFTGKLAVLPRARQIEMVRQCGYVIGCIDTDVLLGKFYVQFNFIGPWGDFEQYHTISARAARVKQLIYDTLKSPLYNAYPGIDGIKWHYQVRRGWDVGNGYHEVSAEWLDFYVPFDLLKKFEAGTLTEQNLVNKSRILVDGVPTKVTVPATLGFPYFLGPKGGCYKINSSGTKTYVDANLCS